MSSFSTPDNDFTTDIEQVAATGGHGVGLSEAKLPPDDLLAVRAALAQRGLVPTLCVPRVFTLLPTQLSDEGEPADVRSRAELVAQGVIRLAMLDPVAVVVAPGASGDPEQPAGPVEAIAEGLAHVADVAAQVGVRIGFEPLGRRRGCAITSLDETAQLLDSLGRKNVSIVFDMWHGWDEPGLETQLRRHVDRICGVQVSDVNRPERSWCDRVLPGEGRGIARSLIAMLLDAGYDGWWELEVLSDDGRFGNRFPDSLWAMDHEELLRRGKEAFDREYLHALHRVSPDSQASSGKAAPRRRPPLR